MILFNRRSFLINSMKAIGATMVASSFSCSEKSNDIPASIVGASVAIGHKLRFDKIPEPTLIEEIDTIIVGGGVAGLSAARYLHKKGNHHFKVLELENSAGGNSAYGSNNISAYPWGAHYLPIPNPENSEDLFDFLKEANIVTSFNSKGLPVYNDYYLCFDPEERLFINGYWQDGIIPNFGLSEKERKEIKDFMLLMEDFRRRKGMDGKYAFTIPVDFSSQDSEFTALDKISMAEYLKQKGFTSSHLYWYADYCCRDDYGTNVNNTSAWAGIHYFAARKGEAANASQGTVLTWPEGNGFLVKKLSEKLKDKVISNQLVYSVKIENGKVLVDYLDSQTHKTHRYIGSNCIMATPQFIANRLLDRSHETISQSTFSYAPWMVANITIKEFKDRKGAPLSWDNVFYDSKSLGYVNANHQNENTFHDKRVITYYLPLTDGDPVAERKKLYDTDALYWRNHIINDLSQIHPEIAKSIENIDIWRWGHGMVRPIPGFIWSDERKNARQSIEEKIFFAHSDLSGISIFEEAFYQGTRAAKELLNKS
ncbi:MAG: NAD(P)-binding protein [Sporocytophaga sp.]|uniref:NAD(P)-binding protein n=1 Tax=Sporocytophaga sp. TaxID=2231183 RepID=UPI001AFEB36C|nr:NAD(P)/FAD-dependent oxidoreductase [Sporocytophaga sp.]MBO9702396.1 NAD(P)-binding protein [Sporocytophaga sp.]